MKTIFKLAFLLIILFLYACKSDMTSASTGVSPLVNVTAIETKLANPDNLGFKFSTDTSYQHMNGKIVNLNCTLYNGNVDTLYFYTYSCFGWEQNFIVDTNNIQIYNWIDCNVSNPIIKKVGPKSSFEFNGHFFVKDLKLKNIQVQYFIYQVDSNFDIRNSDSIGKLKKTVIENHV